MPSSQAALASRKDSQQLLEPFVAAVCDYALLVLNRDGHVLSWNRGAELISGYAAGEVIGRRHSCLYLPEEVVARKPERVLEVAFHEGRHEEIGERVRKNGSRFLANVLITAIPGPDGVPTGFGVIMRDITARLAAEDLVKASAARLRSLIDTVLDTVVDGLVTIDRNGIIQSYNKACVTLFGYAVEEVLGRNVNILMPEPDRSGHDRYVSSNLETGMARIIGTGREVMGRRKDGSTFPMELAVSELPQGGDLAFVGTIRDLTERREAEKQREQLRQAQKMEAVGQLTGGLAHDFNNLLAIIIGNLDLLRELRQDDLVTEELVRDALESALRGADLTRRLLAFARRQPLQPERANINEVIGGIVKLLTRTLGENIAIELALSPTVWPVQIDRAQFEAVIANLATNARDAMPKGGTLLIDTRNGQLDEAYAAAHGEVTPGDYVVIELSDSGCGMPPEILARIFEPFFTTKEQGKGTGLGLSMVFGFMKQSGGHIAVYSEPGKGTTFRLFLPSLESVAITQTERSTKPAWRGGSETVLVVEDNAGLRRIVVRQLSEAGYHVLQAPDAVAAMALIDGPDPIHLLLTDIVMPGEMDGRDLARAAVRQRPLINVLLTSGFPDARLPGTGSRTPGSRLLIKPYRKEELLRAVREAIDDPIQGAVSPTP
ncbi:MAG TPA: PAS domain S-box protein [Acetobacteraceae bacterium]|nr:PAS domain S-box protein [Acetobacteraceae bacterium]